METTVKKTKRALFKSLGFVGIGLSTLLCALPIVGTILGIGALSVSNIYFERAGLAVLIVSVGFLAIWVLKKRKLDTVPACDAGFTPSDTDSCNPSVADSDTAMFNKIVSACKHSFSNDERLKAEHYLKSGYYKKIKSINELETGFEIIFDEPKEFAAKLVELVNLEKKCASKYTIALVFEPNSNVIRYQYYGSPEIKEELRIAFKGLGLLK